VCNGGGCGQCAGCSGDGDRSRAPAVAVLLALSVSTLVVVVGLVANVAVTPAGQAGCGKRTLPVNPFTSVTVMVSVPLLP
jgi:hypothetical protein